MKTLKNIIVSVLFLFVTITITHCSSAQNQKNQNQFQLQEKPSFVVSEVSFEKWIAGIQGGGSGINMNIFIKENKNYVVFDSVYFRDYGAKIETGKMSYFAIIKTTINQRKDYNMSHDEKTEYGNDPLKIQNKPIFEIQDDECVIRYEEKGLTKYYKHTNVIEKPTLNYPSAPPNKD